MKKLLSKFFGDPNERALKKLQPKLESINLLEKKLEGLPDEEIQEKALQLKNRLYKKGLRAQILDEALIEAFALVKEAAKRTLNQRPFDEQILGGIVLHQGKIAEMKTGEGKTLAATMPVYLNALSGQGVHVVTVNDYLAQRDTVWMGQIYDFLGLKVACITQDGGWIYQSGKRPASAPATADRQKTRLCSGYGRQASDKGQEEDLDKKRDILGSFKIIHEYLKPVPKKEAYEADITYGTNNIFGFDYLRDNLVGDLAEKVQRPYFFAILDEIDSILIDEARTPLIISAPDIQSSKLYQKFARIIPKLKPEKDYLIDEKMRAVTLTEKGINKIESLLGEKNLYTEGSLDKIFHLEQALKAFALFKKDRDYVVRDGQVIIVDEFTGRLMPDRRYSEGLHQALEAKEGVPIREESRTLATITFQNLFRKYPKLAGMTGTALTSAEEFDKTYGLEVVAIPTHKPMIRKDHPDSIFATEKGKFKAVVSEIKKRHQKGQPLLVGTVSIERNELLSRFLKRQGVPHQVLNAKHHEKEAEIIAQAGRIGAVTVATNMAGRGVDIVLGGNPPDLQEAEKVKALGGLCVIGTERHEARRIDNQLRGRSGRQGDPGESKFFVSLEDDLMRVFGSDKVKALMQRMKFPEDQPIQNKFISNAIEKAQAQIEGHNFDLRKYVLEYDEVLNKQREAIYNLRDSILKKSEEKAGLQEVVQDFLGQSLERMIAEHTAGERIKDWSLKRLVDELREILAFWTLETDDLLKAVPPASTPAKKRELLTDKLFQETTRLYKAWRKKTGADEARQIEKAILLQTIDNFWMRHLEAMSYLRETVRLRAYGQRDPLVEYKHEANLAFRKLMAEIQDRVFRTLFKVRVVSPFRPELAFSGGQILPQFAPFASPLEVTPQPRIPSPSSPTSFEARPKVGRNQPCPCGSGKKFKKCCLDKYR